MRITPAMPVSTEDDTSNQRSSPWRSHGRLKLFSDPHFLGRELEFAEIKMLFTSFSHSFPGSLDGPNASDYAEQNYEFSKNA